MTFQSYVVGLRASQSWVVDHGRAIQSHVVGSGENPFLCCGPGVHALYMYYCIGYFVGTH